MHVRFPTSRRSGRSRGGAHSYAPGTRALRRATPPAIASTRASVSASPVATSGSRRGASAARRPGCASADSPTFRAAPRAGRLRAEIATRADRPRDRRSGRGQRGEGAAFVLFGRFGKRRTGICPHRLSQNSTSHCSRRCSHDPQRGIGRAARCRRPPAHGRTARPGGSRRASTRTPAVVFTIAMLAGLLVIAAASIGAGLLVTRVIEPAWGIGAADERVNVWLAAHRTPGRTHASLIGSIVAGGVVLPILVAVLAVACAVLRKWRVAAFVVFALAVEAATYRITTLVVHVHRPRVVRLEQLPVNASYPSGHTAASVAVYGGLALLVTSRFENGGPHARLGVRRRDGRVRRTVAHVPRHASSARRCRRPACGHRSTGRGRLRLPSGGRGPRQTPRR